MSNHSHIPLTLCIIATLFFPVVSPAFAEEELSTSFQKEARKYREEGIELQKEGDFNAALSAYQKATVLDPAYAVAYNDAGIILEMGGDIGRAKDMYLKAIQVDPGYPNSYSNIALLYEGQGDYSSAVLYWVKRALIGPPQDPWADAARRRLEDIARIYPEAYRNVGKQYEDRLQQKNTAKPDLQEFLILKSQEPKKIGLFGNDEAYTGEQRLDKRAQAAKYLASAKESFGKAEYVTALKEATVAEYLDPSSREISDFVDRVRKRLLQ
ncbi:MAG: tetratricopeptide repeat protein [Candidatus Omnitrophota bacterium]